MKLWSVLALALLVTGCASAPLQPPAAVKAPAGPTFEQKMAWIVRLEDQRILHDPLPPPPPPAPPPAPPPKGKRAAAIPVPVVAPPPPPVADLLQLLQDSEARIRRRAALAVGHVGLADGVPPLLKLLGDDDAEVRQMAAFALGLLHDPRARDPLVAVLDDPSPLVQGSAAEALGLIGDAGAAEAVGRLVTTVVNSGALTSPPGEEDDARRDTPTAACRLGLFALVRLKAYPQIAAAVLDSRGEPRVHWWPVAFALQRLEDRRAVPALLTLAKDNNPYARAFAVKGLGAARESSAMPILMPLLSSGERSVLMETIRAIGRIGDPAGAEALLKIVHDPASDPQARLEAVQALGGVRSRSVPGVMDTLLDTLSDPSPPMRVAALRATADLDPTGFVTVLSGLDPDPHWSVRAALASTLATLNLGVALPRLNAMLADSDQRVIPSVLGALVKLKAPNAERVLLERLKADDPVVRAAAATGLGDLKPANGAPALAEAYAAAERDPIYTARTATLVLRRALADKDWAVRVRAAMLLKEIDPSGATDVDMAIRPAPTSVPADTYAAARVIGPVVSTQIYIDTDRGTIQIELAMLDAPLTVENFVTLARKGYFDGLGIHRVVPNFVVQDGDPRGDGEGSPGYTIRDEINEHPYLRGAVGMALDPWPDTGGSQFFIVHSPQPHLDARYTVFGRVVAGMDVVDRIQEWDVIRRVHVWDGQQMTAQRP
jgi:cyclophilin family peptidyl-prolyl cis-trans isomerase/HEAT repeat protein